MKYRGMHLIDKGVIERNEFLVPYAEDPSGVITYYTTQLASRPRFAGSRVRSPQSRRWSATTSSARL